MKRKTIIGWCFCNSKNDLYIFKNKEEIFETSSTIKVPIIYFVLRKMLNENLPFDLMLKVEDRHLSNGSGLVNWTNWRILTLKDTLRFTVKYSDCVTTNMLIDFIGGKEIINIYLKNRSYRTTLNKALINFKEIERTMPKVGSTTPEEILKIFMILLNSSWPSEYKKFIKEIFGDVYASWFDVLLPQNVKNNLWHKTGSMINIGKCGDTVFNVVGKVKYKGKSIYFSLLSRTTFKVRPTENQIKDLQKDLAVKFMRCLEKSV